MSSALGARLSRITPDRELLYGKWRTPAGTPVSMSLILLHSDEAIYPEAHNFNPERWMDPSGGACENGQAVTVHEPLLPRRAVNTMHIAAQHPVGPLRLGIAKVHNQAVGLLPEDRTCKPPMTFARSVMVPKSVWWIILVRTSSSLLAAKASMSRMTVPEGLVGTCKRVKASGRKESWVASVVLMAASMLCPCPRKDAKRGRRVCTSGGIGCVVAVPRMLSWPRLNHSKRSGSSVSILACLRALILPGWH